jgi:cytochrome c-type biogenesis protein
LDVARPLRELLSGLLDGLPLGYAFAAGFLASVGSCGFPLLVAYVGYYVGEGESRPWRGVVLGLLATAGFLVLFAGVGLIVSLAGQGLVRVFRGVGGVVGVGLITLGVWQLAGGSWGIIGVVPLPRARGPLAFFLFGLAYGLVSVGCSLPIFLVVVAGSVASRGLASGLGQFLSYGLGMASVLVMVSLGLAVFKGAVVGRLRSMRPRMRWFVGLLLILAGTYVIYQEVLFAI